MNLDDHANIHSERERILEIIVQAKLLYAVTPRVPEYRKTLFAVRPRRPLRGYSLWVKESYEAYLRNHM
ncbi:MAG: hypothetical protein ACUVQ0_02105 [Thermoproteota archaeon]